MKKGRALIGLFVGWFIISLLGFAWLFSGCADEGVSPGGAVRGPGEVDAGVQVDVQTPPDLQQPDTLLPDLQVQKPDVIPAVDTTPVPPPVDARPGAAPDVQPVVCDKLGPFASTGGVALPIPLPTTVYCFKLCPEARDPINPLDYSWTCTGFIDTDRTITVNGQKVSCGARALPTTANGVWAFELSAGGHVNDFISWTGALHACP